MMKPISIFTTKIYDSFYTSTVPSYDTISGVVEFKDTAWSFAEWSLSDCCSMSFLHSSLLPSVSFPSHFTLSWVFMTGFFEITSLWPFMIFALAESLCCWFPRGLEQEDSLFLPSFGDLGRVVGIWLVHTWDASQYKCKEEKKVNAYS